MPCRPMVIAVSILLPTLNVCAAGKGPVAEWRFDDASGDLAVDSSGHGYDADVIGARWVKGAFGIALHFAGRKSWVEAPAVAELDGAAAMSVEAWVLWEGGGRYPNILTGGVWSPGGFLMFVRDRSCSFRMGRPGHRAGAPGSQWQETSCPLLTDFELGRWYHLAATFQRPLITTYVDGRRIGARQWDYPVEHGGAIQVGRWGGSENCHRGLIDEVRLYDRALTAAEVSQSYAAESQRRQSKPTDATYEFLPREARRPAVVELGGDNWRLGIDDRGRCVALRDAKTGKDYVETVAPLVTIVRSGREIRPTSMRRRGAELYFSFPRESAEVVLRVGEHPDYVTLGVGGVSGEGVDSVRLLNLHLRKPRSAMTMSGAVVYDDFAVCTRALDVRTHVTVRGGDIQAHCDRTYGMSGARVGLCAGKPMLLLPALKSMAENEPGIPRSPQGGPWALEAEDNRGSYLFARMSENDVDDWINLAKRCGFRCVHFIAWWEALGHYAPNRRLFPSGLAGMKSAVQRIHAAGLKAGMHTLTGCISPRDSWVTPVPDSRLAADATYELAMDVDAGADRIVTTAPPQNHDVVWGYASRGNVLRIGSELIQYAGISREPPYGFTQCRRGAFGTKAAAHARGERSHHLRCIYGAFYPDPQTTLVGEVADAIAQVYNQCQFDQIYMDGAEGMGSWYGVAVMRDAIFRRLQRPALVEASSWGHWSWWMHSRVGAWDHPRWGLKRFTDMHFAQVPVYQQGGLLQAQLGWWAVLGPSADWRAETPDEMAYFCGKALAHDTPISLQGLGARRRPANARLTELLTIAGQYERLRLARYFTSPTRRLMQRSGREFRLRQRGDGQWEVVPIRIVQHKVTGAAGGVQRWSVRNPFGGQQPRIRIESLYTASPADSAGAVPLLEDAQIESLRVRRTAAGVEAAVQPSPAPIDGRRAMVVLAATNNGASTEGAWAHFGVSFRPDRSLGRAAAVTLWVHGDGKGEVLNVQLATPREYMQAYSEHYVVIDFTGWRRCELLLRERDASRYHDYRWPYFSQHGIFRTSLNRSHVRQLNLYLNNLPPGDAVKVGLSAVRATPVRSQIVRRPSLRLGDGQIAFDAELPSGSYLEWDSTTGCVVYDERGEPTGRADVDGDVRLAPGDQDVLFVCASPPTPRVQVTLAAQGEPVGEKSPDDRIQWSALADEYDLPHVLTAFDGHQNRWRVHCRRHEGPILLGIEMEVVRVDETGTQGRVLDGCEDVLPFANGPDNQYRQYVYDSRHKGVDATPGVTHALTVSEQSPKAGKACLNYTAVSQRPDNGGWCARGRRFRPVVSLADCGSIGFWLRGDGGGETFKLQLRDSKGGWFDMVTRVDFVGWRRRRFDLSQATGLELGAVEYLIMFFNGIPAGSTVSCSLDDVRALPPALPLRRPQVTAGATTVVFPVELHGGDRLIYDGQGQARWLHGSETTGVSPAGGPLRLLPGENIVEVDVASGSASRFVGRVAMEKHYR